MSSVPRWLRILNWVAATLTVVAIVVAVAVVWTVRRSMPQTEGTLAVSGLSAPVTVIRDDWGIPQVYADTSADLFFAQGYVQAQDRFFEMDFRRHLTAGRLTELFGRDALEADMFVRTLGWRRVAEAELPLLSVQTRNYLESFAEGVNAYLAQHSGSRMSLEYAVLGLTGLDYAPKPWTPADSLAWMKAMAWNLGGNLDDEVARSLESVHLSRRQIAELYPDYPYEENSPIVNQGGLVDGVYEQNAKGNDTRLPSRPAYPVVHARSALRRAAAATQTLRRALGVGDGMGSNAWAVSGAHTASGAPILANDPHLDASMPSVWYQMGLHCRTVSADCPFDVSGFTFAGLPGVVIGHNASIAWGFTNLNADVQDLYLEKVVAGNRYLYNGRFSKLRTRQERFVIAGEPNPLTITVRESRHGPLISDVSSDFSTVGADSPVDDQSPNRGHGYAVALRWTALQPGRTADALFGIDLASNWNQFRDAAGSFDAPSQNLVYADTAGHIGYQAPGRIPSRRTGDGTWPVPGWDPAYEWTGFVPFDALPNVLDPQDGYVVTANQPVTDDRYPYFLGSSFDYGYRAQRIRDLLKSRDKLTVDDMAAIQLDTYTALAKRLTPLLVAAPVRTAYYQMATRVLSNWDYHQDADSAGAAYFNVVWRNLLRLTFDDDLPEKSWPIGGSRWWTVVLNLLDKPHNALWDDADTSGVVETRDDIVLQAMLDARDELTRKASRDPHEWEWGRLHTLTLRNESLGAVGSPVAFLFNRGGYRLSGGPAVVDASSWDATKGYAATAVPSMRMIVPLDDLDAARWINLTGASGHAYDGNYTDQTQLWLDGKTLPWAFSRGAVEAAGEHTLTLRPPG
jgi:penicillin G amidase